MRLKNHPKRFESRPVQGQNTFSFFFIILSFLGPVDGLPWMGSRGWAPVDGLPWMGSRGWAQSESPHDAGESLRRSGAAAQRAGPFKFVSPKNTQNSNLFNDFFDCLFLFDLEELTMGSGELSWAVGANS